MAIAFKQLELDLWGDLKSALNEPETADLQGVKVAKLHTRAMRSLKRLGSKESS